MANFCPQCGAPAGGAFCSKCGQPLGPAAPAQPPSPPAQPPAPVAATPAALGPPAKSSGVFLKVLLVVVAFFVVLGAAGIMVGWYAWTKVKEKVQEYGLDTGSV